MDSVREPWDALVAERAAAWDALPDSVSGDAAPKGATLAERIAALAGWADREHKSHGRAHRDRMRLRTGKAAVLAYLDDCDNGMGSVNGDEVRALLGAAAARPEQDPIRDDHPQRNKNPQVGAVRITDFTTVQRLKGISLYLRLQGMSIDAAYLEGLIDTTAATPEGQPAERTASGVVIPYCEHGVLMIAACGSCDRPARESHGMDCCWDCFRGRRVHIPGDSCCCAWSEETR